MISAAVGLEQLGAGGEAAGLSLGMRRPRRGHLLMQSRSGLRLAPEINYHQLIVRF
jgi:hypothetical protein